MKTTQFAPILIATSMAFSLSSQAAAPVAVKKTPSKTAKTVQVPPTEDMEDLIARLSKADEKATYTLKTHQGKSFQIKADNIHTVFKSATNLIAAKTQDGTLAVGWENRDFVYEIGDMQDQNGKKVGKCSVLGYVPYISKFAGKSEPIPYAAEETSDPNLKTSQNGFQYKAHCWDEKPGIKAAYAQTPFTYDK